MAEDQKLEPDRPMAASPEAALLRQVLKFISRNLVVLAAGPVAGVFLGLAAQKYMPAKFEAEGRFVVDELPFLQNAGQNANATASATQDDLVESLIMGIPSASMRREAGARLGVQEGRICFEDLGTRPLSLRGRDAVANVRVSSVRDSRTGTIDVTSQSAEFAARTANAVLDELANYNLAQGRLNALDLSRQITMTRVESIRTQLAQLEPTLDWREQQVMQLDEHLKQHLPLESFAEFAQDTTLNNLKTERLLNEADYAGTASVSSGGPELEKKKAMVENINKEIEKQAESLAAGQRTQLAATRMQKKSLEDDLKDMLQSVQRSSEEREKWVQSFGDITAMKKMIGGDTNSEAGSAIVVVNRAVPAERPEWPKLWLNLAVGIFAGGLAGLMMAAGLTLLDERLARPECVAALTQLPCVMTGVRRGIFSWNRRAPAGPAGFNSLRGRLLLSKPGAKKQIIGFTPAGNRESASSAVADLALMLSGAGRKTLVVDLHYTQPRQFALLGIEPRSGLGDWMASDNDIKNYIWESGSGELAVLSCEPGKRAADELAARRPLARYLTQLENGWDFVLIDAPAISLRWDLMLALPPGSGVVITGNRRTRGSRVVRTAELAWQQEWKVIGVALGGGWVVRRGNRRAARVEEGTAPPVARLNGDQEKVRRAGNIAHGDGK